MTEVCQEDIQLKAEIKSILHGCLCRVLHCKLTQGTFHGTEFRVGNVKGDSGKSLVVQLEGPKAGLWRDFATGEHGDILTLWALIHGMDIKRDFRKVIASVQEWLGIVPKAVPTETQTQKLAAISDPITVVANSSKSVSAIDLTPEPAEATVIDVPEPSSASISTAPSSLGTLTGQWTYTDADGNPITIIKRFDTASGKQFRPYDVKTSKYQKPAEPRPLYNLPNIKAAQRVVIVEGEKAAQALIDIGICATTAMFGANAALDKTDWSVLSRKEILIWPDNDEPGKQYAKAVAQKLEAEGMCALSIVKTPKAKPTKWDAADAVAEGEDINKLLKQKIAAIEGVQTAFTADDWFDDKSPTPDDIIAPRVLTYHGILVFAGAPKVGKSELILSWLINAAAGKSFLGMSPPRPLKVFYMQAEVEHHYFKERMHALEPDHELRKIMGKNLVATPQCQVLLDKNGVEKMRKTILYHFPNRDIDIIAVDPFRQVFDGGENNLSENDNNAMHTFLKERISALRDSINPKAGVILIHHVRKLNADQIHEEGFNAIAGAGSLRAFFSSGILMYQPDENIPHWILKFELRNGKKLKDKHLGRNDKGWCEYTDGEIPDSNHEYKLSVKCNKKRDSIIDIIYNEAREGRLYTSSSFAQRWEHKSNLGGRHAIRDRIDVLTSQSYIRFIKDGARRSRNGYLCVEGMEMPVDEINVGTNAISKVYKRILPTHYKATDGMLVEITTPEKWIYPVGIK